MRLRLRSAVAGLLSVLVLVSGLLAQSAVAQTPGTVGIRILDAPQNRAEDPRARLYIVDHLPPGTTINRRLEISNDTNEARDIQLYAAAADIVNGQFRFGDGRAANDLTRWTSVDPTRLNVPPGQKAITTVKVTVPADAPSGEQYAVIWAEMSSPPSPGQGVGAVNRVGVRMYLSVGPGGEPASDFEVTEVQGRRDKDGNPVVAATVNNTGGRALDLSGELMLTNGPGGLSAGPFDANLGTTLAPGDTAPVLFTLDAQLPNGPWDAKVDMRSGTTTRDASATITFPDKAGGAGPAAKPKSGLSALVYLGGGAGLLGLLLLLSFLFIRGRRPKTPGAATRPVLAPTSPAPTAATPAAVTPEPATTAPAAQSPPQAWYPDPERPGQLRWWDGKQWTEHRHPGNTSGG